VVEERIDAVFGSAVEVNLSGIFGLLSSFQFGVVSAMPSSVVAAAAAVVSEAKEESIDSVISTGGDVEE